MPNRPGRDPHKIKQRKFKVGGDPVFKMSRGRGNLAAKDYTRFIKWTPKTIAIAALITAGPYFGTVALLWVKLGFGAALGLVVLGIMLSCFIGLMYWFAKADL